MKPKVIALAILILFISLPVWSKACRSLFPEGRIVPSFELGFTQDSVGLAKASLNVPDVSKKYKETRTANQKLTKKNYVLQFTQAKPFPVIIDIEGTVRLHDRHHRFWTLSRFIGKGRAFSVWATIDRDYTLPNPVTGRPWTEAEMMADAIANDYVYFKKSENPSFVDLKNLPRNIFEIPDDVLRSIVSFVFGSFSTPLKGEDFTSKIQLLFMDKIIEYGVDFSHKRPMSKGHIDKIRTQVLQSPTLLDFLLQNISPKISEKRNTLVVDFLQKSILEAEAFRNENPQAQSIDVSLENL